jgi:serine/threonine-protein kinase
MRFAGREVIFKNQAVISDPLKPPVRFVLGEWTIDRGLGCVSRGDEVRRVRPLVMDLLLLLVSHQGQVVSKDAIVAGAWAGAAIADSVVTSTVAELRQVLGDQAQDPSYIQTIPKRGYRLIALVSEVAPALMPGLAPAVEPVSEMPRSAEPAGPRPRTAVPPGAVAEAPATGRPTHRPRVWMVGFFIGTACALALVISMATRRIPPSSAGDAAETRLVVALPSGMRLGTSNTPQVALSPDGTRLAYVARTTGGTILCLRTLAAFDTISVAGSEGARAPFFSPTGDRIAFFAGGELRIASLTGGRPVFVAPAPAAFGGTWSADDTIIFGGAHGEGLRQVSAQGGTAQTLTSLDRQRGELSHRWPAVLPGGRTIVFTAIGLKVNDIVAFNPETGERHVVLTDAEYARALPPDRLIYAQKGKVFAARFNLRTWKSTGPGVVIADDVMTAPVNGVADFAVARTGAVVYVPAELDDLAGELAWMDRAGGLTPIGAPLRPYMHPRLSPDERQILTWTRTGDEDLWLYDLGAAQLQRLVTGLSGHRADWSPDGTRLIFDAPVDKNRVRLFVAPVSGGQPQPLAIADPTIYYSSSWSPDGRHVALVHVSRANGFDIELLTLDPAGTLTPLMTSAANETAPRFSPDGHWLAFVSNQSGSDEVYISPYPPNGSPIRVSSSGGREPVWSRTGRELFYRQGDALMAVDVSQENGVRISRPRTLFTARFDERPSWRPNYDVARDGRFLVVRSATDPRAGSAIAVLLNWQNRLTPRTTPLQ